MLALVDCLVQGPYDPVHARSGLGEPQRREPATLDEVSVAQHLNARVVIAVWGPLLQPVFENEILGLTAMLLRDSYATASHHTRWPCAKA